MTKLNRSETVTVRLDPRLNYLTELAGRAQRRTKSSFIEWAIKEAIRDLGIESDLMVWRPIETAPKDGTRILVWTTTDNDVDRQYVDEVCDGDNFACAQVSSWEGMPDSAGSWWNKELIGEPTHWMPLPGAPE